MKKVRSKSIVSVAKTQAPDAGEYYNGKYKKGKKPFLVEAPSLMPNIDPKAIEERAKKTGKKVIKVKLLVLLLALIGIAAPYELIALSLICLLPLSVTIVAFIRSRLDRDKWADLVGKGAVAMIIAALLVILRGMYVSAEPVAKVSSLLIQISTGIPSGVWAGLFTGGVPAVPMLHITLAAGLTAAAIFVLYLQVKNYHLSRPAKPRDYRTAQRLRPRRARQLPRRIIN